jgi:predicted AAA+ superfamily ATPase
MNKELIKKLIVENREFIQRIDLTERELKIEGHGNYVFTGLRRAGKTYMMYQIAKSLIADGVEPERILYFEFEDERLAEFESKDFDMILECYRELYEHEPIIFLDEIQIIDGWEKYARRLADEKYRIYLTGSNAKMLSGEIAGALGGRYIVKDIYPMSFAEYLSATGTAPQGDWEHGRPRFAVRKRCEEYLRFGGMPELLLFKEKRQWLSALYQKVFYGDIILRHQIRNDHALRLLVKKLAESVMADISYNRLRNIIASSGAKIGTSTVIEYIGYLGESFLIYEATNALAKFVDKETDKKYYFADNGVLSLFLDGPENRLLENLVACELVRRGHPLKFAKGKTEVDFVVAEEKTAIQVAWDISNPYTERREADSLLSACTSLDIGRFVIVTMDEERVIEYNGVSIEVVPVHKWLLS